LTYFLHFLFQKGSPQGEIERILSCGNNSELFAEELLNLEDEKVLRFLDRLEDYALSDSYIPKENIEPIITALIDIGDLLPEDDLISLGIYEKLHSLFDKLSHRFESYDESSVFSNEQLRKVQGAYILSFTR